VPEINRRDALRALSATSAALIAASVAPAFSMAGRIKPGASSALIVVDVQNCFVTGGTLAVAHGEDVVPVINQIAPAFQNIIVTQDWHPAGHISFASAHAGAKPFETLRLPYGDQVLWPDHCIQGTADAALYPKLRLPRTQLILRKGFHQGVDSYSAFEEADRRTPTGLDGYLKQRDIGTLFVTGLATDFCVQWTALDARQLGFETYVIEDACRGIDIHGSVAAAWKAMTDSGVILIQSSDISIPNLAGADSGRMSSTEIINVSSITR
jgi:nicotinamidase/pyrazinamidase